MIESGVASIVSIGLLLVSGIVVTAIAMILFPVYGVTLIIACIRSRSKRWFPIARWLIAASAGVLVASICVTAVLVWYVFSETPNGAMIIRDIMTYARIPYCITIVLHVIGLIVAIVYRDYDLPADAESTPWYHGIAVHLWVALGVIALLGGVLVWVAMRMIGVAMG